MLWEKTEATGVGGDAGRKGTFLREMETRTCSN
jgi:hypothetical protein